MHKINGIVTAISLALLTTPLAANASVIREPFIGPYVGIDAGGAWATSNYQTNPGCGSPTSSAVFCNVNSDPSSVNGTAVANSGSGKLNLNGFNYDLHAGYNWHHSNFVYGGEAEFGGLNLSQSTTTSGVFPFAFLGTNYTLYDAVSTNWLATLRGRLGMLAQPQLLLYATGGLAFTDLKVSSNYNDNAIGGGLLGGIGSASNSQFKTGWTLGVGGEWFVTDYYSIKAEYLYVKFGSASVSVPLSNSPAFTQTMRVSGNLDTQLLRIGINYRI